MKEIFIYKGKDYTKSVTSAIERAKSKASYPSSSFQKGIKELHGERALFRLIIGDELRRSRVPKELIKRLTK